MKKPKAIVDNLNNERVATLYEEELTKGLKVTSQKDKSIFRLGLKKGKQEGFKEGEHHALNSFFLWLDWLIRTPKMSWKEKIKTKANQIFVKLNKKEII